MFFYDNQYERAAHLYEEVLKSDPRDGVSLVRLGHVYRQRMNYKRARELLEQAELQFPNSIEVTFNLALLDRDEGLLENSLERIAEALEESERPGRRVHQRRNAESPGLLDPNGSAELEPGSFR